MDLAAGPVGLRPIRRRDAEAWAEVRARNREWLREWDATMPPGGEPWASGFGGMVREMRAQARQGRMLPFVVTYDGRLVGQVTVNNIVWGSARFGQLGYWVDQRYAGRGIIPTAVALAVDHAFQAMGLHRMEVAIRPENTASLRVVEKLGFQCIGTASRYLHINGAWRDHVLFALTAEDVPDGLLQRWEAARR
ncbi:MAG: GNAT family N-acetyltransferase [Actinomycetota bacterium]|nr:GNAT family N-acetyltransferase [Actinomycetota bacterium]